MERATLKRSAEKCKIEVIIQLEQETRHRLIYKAVSSSDT